MAEPRRWFDPSQPQTLQSAVMICYVITALSLLFILFGSFPELAVLGLGVAGYGVANERRWGYWLGVVLAALNALVWLALLAESSFQLGFLINLGFMVALAALFLHPQSREYQRVWFK
ncbi:MAG TPA: hypothetical protein VLZ77_08810 [Acidimicrobiales bacterium]|nr:hypothetical protein [Acidimicrobiales bacterium]